MNNQSLTAAQKLAYIQSNINKLPQKYHNNIQSLSSLLETNQNVGLVKLQTFYLLIQSALSSLHWQQPYNENLYPVALLIANKIEENKTNNTVSMKTNTTISNNNLNSSGQQYGISFKFVTWVQSGGVRCICIKPNLQGTQQKIYTQIEKFVHMSHCAVVGDLFEELDQKMRKWMQIFINIAKKVQGYPIMFIKNMAKQALDFLCDSKIQTRKPQYGLTEFYASYQSALFKGLDLSLRILFENNKKIAYPSKFIQSSFLTENSQFLKTSGLMLSKSNEQMSVILQHTQLPIFLVFCDPCCSQLPQDMKFWHNLIINFINLTKKHKKETDEKKVDKHLIANCKVVQIGDKTYYKSGN